MLNARHPVFPGGRVVRPGLVTNRLHRYEHELKGNGVRLALGVLPHKPVRSFVRLLGRQGTDCVITHVHTLGGSRIEVCGHKDGLHR